MVFQLSIAEDSFSQRISHDSRKPISSNHEPMLRRRKLFFQVSIHENRTPDLPIIPLSRFALRLFRFLRFTIPFSPYRCMQEIRTVTAYRICKQTKNKKADNENIFLLSPVFIALFDSHCHDKTWSRLELLLLLITRRVEKKFPCTMKIYFDVSTSSFAKYTLSPLFLPLFPYRTVIIIQ